MTLTINTFGSISYPKGSRFGPRTCTDYELVWVLDGSCEWCCNDQRLVLNPDELALVWPNDHDSFHWNGPRGCVHSFIHFHWDSPYELSRHYIDCDPTIISLCNSACHRAGTQPALALRSLELALDLLHNPPPPASRQHPVINNVIEALELWWFRQGRLLTPSIDQLCDWSGYSRSQLTRLFHQHCGYSPAETIILIRLERAAEKLVRSHQAIASIAEDCGFANPYHFSRRFSQAYGLSPRAFRKQAALGHAPDVAPLTKSLTGL